MNVLLTCKGNHCSTCNVNLFVVRFRCGHCFGFHWFWSSWKWNKYMQIRKYHVEFRYGFLFKNLNCKWISDCLNLPKLVFSFPVVSISFVVVVLVVGLSRIYGIHVILSLNNLEIILHLIQLDNVNVENYYLRNYESVPNQFPPLHIACCSPCRFHNSHR